MAGATINDFSVLVTGLIDPSLGPEFGILVNGYIALRDGGEFAAMVSVNGQTSSLTATLTDPAGVALATDIVPITVQLPSSALLFRLAPAIGVAPFSTSFRLISRNPISQIEFDATGDGIVDFTGTTLDGVTFVYPEPGLYFPDVRVTEVAGAVRTAKALVQVLDFIQLDVLLQGKWQAMKDALRQGNVAVAASYITTRRRTTYQDMFNALTIPLADIDQVLTSVTFVKQHGLDMEYKMTSIEGGFQYFHLVLFTIDEDGVWRIKFF